MSSIINKGVYVELNNSYIDCENNSTYDDSVNDGCANNS